MSIRDASTSKIWLIYLIDLLLVVLFVFMGRLSHGETPGTTLITAIPFTVALSLAWLLPWVRRNPLSIFPSGITIWLGSSFVGQILRVIFGGTTALSFIVVSVCVLAVFLLGWRLLFKVFR